jgi:hypothetical protein
MRRSLAAAGGLLLLLALVSPPVVRAKEHAAGCPALAPALERLRSALVLSAVHRARGSSLGAYQVLATSARSVTTDRALASCPRIVAPLVRALDRAGRAPTALDATLELDVGYTEALALALTGRYLRDDFAVKRIPIPESAAYGRDCADVFQISRRLSAPGGTTEARVGAVLRDLSAKPRCPDLRRLLEATSPENLPYAIDSIALDEPEAQEGGGPEAGAAASKREPGDAAGAAPAEKEKGGRAPARADGETARANPLDRCPELPIVLERLSSAINLGAPLFNRGDHVGCQALYERTARTIATEVVPPGRCPVVRTELAGAMREAKKAPDAGEAAWALRRGFDRIAGVRDR